MSDDYEIIGDYQLRAEQQDGTERVAHDIIPLAGEELGVTIVGGDMEAFLAGRAEAERVAMENLTDRQRKLGPGSKWMRVLADFNGKTLFIFGDMPTRDQFIASEAGYYTKVDVADPDTWDPELRDIVERNDRAAARGYLYGWCYSTVEPDGEPGTTHVSTIDTPLTDDEFGSARAHGWDDGLIAEHTDWFIPLLLDLFGKDVT